MAVKRATSIRIAVIALLLGTVEALCRTGIISSFTMIAPSAMVIGLVEIIRSGKFSLDIAVTLRNVAIAIAAAMIAGPAIAVVLNRLPTPRHHLRSCRLGELDKPAELLSGLLK